MFQPQVCSGQMSVLAIGVCLHSCPEEQLLGSVDVCLWEQGEPGLSHQSVLRCIVGRYKSEHPNLSLSHLEAQKIMA